MSKSGYRSARLVLQVPVPHFLKHRDCCSTCFLPKSTFFGFLMVLDGSWWFLMVLDGSWWFLMVGCMNQSTNKYGHLIPSEFNPFCVTPPTDLNQFRAELGDTLRGKLRQLWTSAYPIGKLVNHLQMCNFHPFSIAKCSLEGKSIIYPWNPSNEHYGKIQWNHCNISIIYPWNPWNP